MKVEEDEEMVQFNDYNEVSSYCIPQLDGLDDTVLEESVPSSLYAVHCENPNVQHWINFFRNFHFSINQGYQ